MAGLMTPSVGSFVPVGETEERTKRLARAAADKQLAENTRQFDLGYGLDRDRFKENVRQFGLGYALDQQRLAENTRQFDLGYGLDRDRYGLELDRFNENVRQFGLDYALREAEDARSAEAWQRKVEALDALRAGRSGPDSGGRSVELAPTREPPTPAQQLLSGSSVAPTVDMPGGLPMGSSGTAGLAVPNLDLAPPASSYSGVSTKDLIDQLSRAENVAAARGTASRNAPAAQRDIANLLKELEARGLSREDIDTYREFVLLSRNQRPTAKERERLETLRGKVGNMALGAVKPPESAPTVEDLAIGSFATTGRVAGLGGGTGAGVDTQATFDFSRRAEALREREAYLERAIQSATAIGTLTNDWSRLQALQAEYAQLGNERTLVAGVNALQAATTGDREPLRQFLADMYNISDVQIYSMDDGTLEIEMNGRSYGRHTLASIRQQLLADLDPATQQAAAAQVKFQQELFLKLAPEELKAAQARGEIKDARFIEPVGGSPFLYYNRGGINYMVPMTTTTIGGAETIRFGEEQPIGSVQ
jgi:hypothetical protein